MADSPEAIEATYQSKYLLEESSHTTESRLMVTCTPELESLLSHAVSGFRTPK